MTNIIDDLLASSTIDNTNQNNDNLKEGLDSIKEKDVSIENVADANILVDKKEEIPDISLVSSGASIRGEQDNKNINNKNINNKNISYKNRIADLSGAFDSVIEKNKQLAYANPINKKAKTKTKNLFYIIIIVVIWSIIIFSIVSASISKKNKKIEREKILQELQLKIQQDVKTQK